MAKTPTLKSLTGVIDPVQELTSKRDIAVQDELAAQQKIQALEATKIETEAKNKAAMEKEKVRSTEELTQRQKQREEPIRQQKSEIDNALMNEHFAPSKENLQDQAALFSLINVIGFAIGAGGKQNAMQAMHAMNGMLEGHQQGRADVFKQEQVKFDKNFKALQQKAVFLENELRHSLEEFTRDKRAADERAEAAFAAAGADFIKVYAEKNGYVAAYERAKEIRKSLDKAIEGERLRKERIEDKANADLQHLQLVQAMKSGLSASKAAGGIGGKPEKTPSDVEKSVRQNALFLSNIEGIVSEADKLIKEGNIRGIGVIQGKIPYDVAQLYMTKAERDFLQDFNALTNQKLKDQSGATVTGAEFARQRGVLPLRDDDPKVILDKLKNWERLIAQETSVYGRAYPGVIRKYGITLDMPSDKSKLVPGLEYKTPRGTMLWDGSNFLEPSGE